MPQDVAAINRMLQSHGLGTLDMGAGLMAQLGYLVQDHEHFRSLLVRCEPENRSAMYDSLRPYVRFQVHSLDHYMAESARLAEARKLPIYDNETGDIKRTTPMPATIRTADEETLQRLGEEEQPVSLTITCRKCTKQAQFCGATQYDAIWRAREQGWVYYIHEGEPRQICPDCPAVRLAN